MRKPIIFLSLFILSVCFFNNCGSTIMIIPSASNPGSHPSNPRSTPSEHLTDRDVNELLSRKRLFDARRNRTEKDFRNRFEFQGYGLILDRSTDLLWQQDGSSDHMSFNETQAYIDSLNMIGFGGYADWRLPTLEEAMTLVEREPRNQSLHIDPLFDAYQHSIWTSDHKSVSRIWVVYFSEGYCFYDRKDYGSSYVRAVR